MKGKITAFDFGARSLKMASFANGELRRCAEAEMPERLVEHGVIQSMDAMADFIREAAKEQRISGGPCAVLLPNELVFTRTTTLPVMTETQLRFNLPYEFRDYISEEKSSYFYDYAVQEMRRDVLTGEPQEMHLFACAVLKKTIADYRAMFRRAGFRMTAAVPHASSFAALRRAGGAESDCCFIDLGDQETRMYFFHGGHYDTRRIIDLGIRDIDACIADTLSVDPHMAHTFLLSNYQDVLGLDCCRQMFSRFAVEIMKGINFYLFSSRDTTLDTAYICGGGAELPQMVEAIGNAISLKVVRTETLPALEEAGYDAFALEAIGCALSLDGVQPEVKKP